ncbi:hypothetical protein C8A05DRAFT_46937 [Staphylotrichum tortipilum]|uniref:Uncharacterized protein n=1 Tax=Staphylotrichum tortipilum TaxID=2831512 RepID=A0AAN6RQL3_9PEZI|nr:hypothetical protein C8A05DRAFT_46937 [Staphylotrichum longicolle]
MRFQAPQLGALGVTFTIMRACQLASLIAIIGLCANFISEIATAEHNPPSELIGTLTVAVTAVIYIVITYILYYDNMLPLLLTGCLDGLLLIASIVVASLVGKPLSMLNCAALSSSSALTGTSFYSSASPQIRSSILTKTLSYLTFVTLDQTTCYEIKAVWGLAIALCVLFAFSALVCNAQQQQPQQAWNRAPNAQQPYFPPPPLAPIRNTGRRPRAAVAAVVGLPPNPRVTVSPPPPSTCESDASSSTYDADRGASPPQPRGLRPPPPPRVRSLTAPSAKPTTLEKGEEAEEEDGISPLLSRAPALLFPPPQTSAHDGLASPSDVIPPEHKRIPVPIPRSPISPPPPPSPATKPSSGLGLGLDFLARRSLRKSTLSISPSRGSKKQLPPPPIVLVVRKNPAGGWGVAKEVSREEVEEVVSAKASLGGVSPVVVPSPAPTKGKKRRTVWEGLVDGWWDLGLLERMGTVRRKR